MAHWRARRGLCWRGSGASARRLTWRDACACAAPETASGQMRMQVPLSCNVLSLSRRREHLHARALQIRAELSTPIHRETGPQRPTHSFWSFLFEKTKLGCGKKLPAFRQRLAHNAVRHAARSRPARSATGHRARTRAIVSNGVNPCF